MNAQKSDSVSYSSNIMSMGVVVKKMKKSLAFYKEALGLIETGSFSLDRTLGHQLGLTRGKPFDVVILKTTDEPKATEFKLMSVKNNATHPKQKHIRDDNGVQYITLNAEDLPPFISRLKRNKVKTLGKTPISLRDGRHFILAQDPDGIFNELLGSLSDK